MTIFDWFDNCLIGILAVVYVACVLFAWEELMGVVRDANEDERTPERTGSGEVLDILGLVASPDGRTASVFPPPTPPEPVTDDEQTTIDMIRDARLSVELIESRLITSPLTRAVLFELAMFREAPSLKSVISRSHWNPDD